MFRNTQDTTKNHKSYLKGTVTHYGSTFQMITVQFITLYRSPTTPILPKQYWFGLIRVRSPLLTESLLFSLPPGTEMFQFPGFAPRLARCRVRTRRVAPFGNPRIDGYLPLRAAYRSLSRPSSPPRAKASFMCPCLLSFFPFEGKSPLVMLLRVGCRL